MKLQEFLSFRNTCFVCDAPLTFRVTDWTEFTKPTHMNVSQVFGMSLIKIYHKHLSIFINSKQNIYIITPKSPTEIKIEIEGVCRENRNHYEYESQMMSLNYNSKSWSQLPEIQTQEIISINKGNIFSVVNSYSEGRTNIVIPDKGLNTLPLISTSDISYDQLFDKLKVYLAFS